jgi:hypothetical protein
MATINMKRAEVEQKGGTLLGEPVDASKEDYHYGLRITLEEPELQKLGLQDPKVGSKIPLDAIGKLVSYAQEESGRRAEILITDLGIKQPPNEEQRTEVMYPPKKA